jgi:hypothetical protein
MDPCTVEIGLLRKKPCGQAAVAQCLNCERPLCIQHAVAEKTASGRKSGKFLCKECHAAWKDIGEPPPAQPAAKPAAPAKDAPAAAAVAPKAAAAPAKPAEPKPAEAKPAEAKPAEVPAAKPADSGMIEFTPTKKP